MDERETKSHEFMSVTLIYSYNLKELSTGNFGKATLCISASKPL